MPLRGKLSPLRLANRKRLAGWVVLAKLNWPLNMLIVTAITIRPERVGTFTTICDHYCGLGHGGMKMTIVVQEASAKSSAAPVVSASNTVSK